MTVKRSRIARSMSFGRLGAINQPSRQPAHFCNPAISAAAAAKPAAAPKPILTVSSSPDTETERELGQGHFGNFLERCYHCNKRMPPNSEIFMYGNLHGFCSLDCRFKQMVSDKLEEISQNSKKTKAKD